MHLICDWVELTWVSSYLASDLLNMLYDIIPKISKPPKVVFMVFRCIEFGLIIQFPGSCLLPQISQIINKYSSNIRYIEKAKTDRNK